MKKVIIAILFVLVIGAGVGGTLYFYTQNKNQIEQNTALAAQNAQVQAQLDAIGTLVTVYEVASEVYSGNQIKETDLVPVTVPASTVNTASITDSSQIIGKYYKIDLQPGTIISADVLMAETNLQREKFTRDIALTALPVSCIPGDYVDFRMFLPNGENYTVLSHKQIIMQYDTTITVKLTEEENWLWDSALVDLGTYSEYGCILYCTKYVEPGLDTDIIGMYPVQHDAEALASFSPNIKDPSRVVNSTLRDHIDHVLLVAADSDNQTVARNIKMVWDSQFQSIVQAGQSWLEEHTDDEGNLVVDGVTTTEGSAEGTYQETVDESMESLETGVEDLEAIE